MAKLSASQRVARGEFSASPILPPTCFSIGSAFCICVADVFREGGTSHVDTNRYFIMYVLKDISDFTTGSEDRYVLSANQGRDTSLIDINKYIIMYVLKDIYDLTTGSEDWYVLPANQGRDTSHIDTNRYIIMYVLKDISDFTTGSEDQYVLPANQGRDTSLRYK